MIYVEAVDIFVLIKDVADRGHSNLKTGEPFAYQAKQINEYSLELLKIAKEMNPDDPDL